MDSRLQYRNKTCICISDYKILQYDFSIRVYHVCMCIQSEPAHLHAGFSATPCKVSAFSKAARLHYLDNISSSISSAILYFS